MHGQKPGEWQVEQNGAPHATIVVVKKQGINVNYKSSVDNLLTPLAASVRRRPHTPFPLGCAVLSATNTRWCAARARPRTPPTVCAEAAD